MSISKAVKIYMNNNINFEGERCLVTSKHRNIDAFVSDLKLKESFLRR